MAQSDFTRRKLAAALGSQPQADALVTIIDAQTGTVGLDLQRRLNMVMGANIGTVAGTKFAAGATLTDMVEGKLTQVVGETAAKEIIAAQDA